MGIFDDTKASAGLLEAMEAATAALPQFPAPTDLSFRGLLPPRLRFSMRRGPVEEKPVGALPRTLVDWHRDAVLTRGHLLSAASLAGETAMRRAEEQIGVPALDLGVERLLVSGGSWAADPRPHFLSASEYVFTVGGLWQIATPETAAGQFLPVAFDQYLEQVPDPVRPQVATRLKGLYADVDAQPRGTYIRSDVLRRYWWAVYALLNIRDDVALNPMFLAFKPHLVLSDEGAWDLLYSTVAGDERLRSIAAALAAFYGLLIGLPNAPNATDYLSGRMGLGRGAAAACAAVHGQPIYNADSVGLGRSLLPTFAAALDRTADRIRQEEIPAGVLYSPAEFGALMAAHRLLLGTPYDPGMVRQQGDASYLERLMRACAATFVSPTAPDSRDLADYMALAVAGLSTGDLAREVPRQFSRGGFGGPGLYLDPRIQPAVVELIGAALGGMQQAIEGLARAANRSAELGDEWAILEALPVLARMAESRHPVSAMSPDFAALAPLDRACEPKATLVFSLEQLNGEHLRMSWLTVPVLVRMVLTQPWGNSAEHRVEAAGLTMLPYQGIVPRVVREDEIPQLFEPLAVEVSGGFDSVEAQEAPRVAYHQSLVVYVTSR